MANHLYGDNYRSYVRVPGYYDPNSHTIFLNKKTFSRTSAQTAFIICYHELVHSLSCHRVVKTKRYQAFQSGIKIERFSPKGYSCLHRALNEGIVQYLTAYYNRIPVEDYAYAKEVALVQQIATTLGHEFIQATLTRGTWRVFKYRFEQHYGANTFECFSQLMDTKHYTEARQILNVT